jgi:hypothetical protein
MPFRKIRDYLLRNKATRGIFFSFPFRLVLLHFKKNIFFLFFWIFFFGIILNLVAPKYGVPFLFLSPEYLDHSGFLAYMILGFSFGGFVMAFNISTYIMNSYRFPFLATLSRPLWKFTLNNFALPVAFIITYIIQVTRFQLKEGVLNGWEIAWVNLGFLTGIGIFLLFSFIYFFRTNKDIHRLFGIRPEREIPKPSAKKLEVFKRLGVRNPNLVTESRDWYVETYLNAPWSAKLVRPVKHYKRAMLRAVFRQNHRNAVKFEVVAILSLFLLGWFDDVAVFYIPAAASLFLLITLIMMLVGALYNFFRGWANFILIFLFILFNLAFSFKILNPTNRLYGLDYSNPVPYTNTKVNELNRDPVARNEDFINNLEILYNWKRKNVLASQQEKPWIVFFNTSGGGLRSTLWTFIVMQEAEKQTEGKFMEHVHLITGSSGGMIGASYYRELYYLSKGGHTFDCNHPTYRENISRDLLNPISFTLATNDWFLPIRKVEIDGKKYNRDRGYAFERKLNEATSRVLDVPLGYYKNPERKSDIPMMIFSPVVINDGRKMLISPQPVSFLTGLPEDNNIAWKKLSNSVEYSRLFAQNSPEKTRLLSILRANSTFPYIFPIASLPTEPTVELMDAGLRDNYGVETALKYFYTFRKWIEENTQGVIFIQIRDKKKEGPITTNPGQTLLQSLSKPLGSFYGNHFTIQDYNHEDLLFFVREWFSGKLEILDFELKNEETDRISLSWHLTNYEKKKILNSLDSPENQESFRKLAKLIGS